MTNTQKTLLGIAGVWLLLQVFTKSANAAGLIDYGDDLGDHFTWDEFTGSAYAENMGIAQQFDPPSDAILSGRKLAQWVLDPVRNHLNRPVIVTGWYRCQELIDALVDDPNYDASPTSNHVRGDVADIVYFDDDDEKDIPALIRAVIQTGVPFDRMLIEGGTLANPQWIHIEYNSDKPINEQRHIIRRINPGGTTGYDLTLNEVAQTYF